MFKTSIVEIGVGMPRVDEVFVFFEHCLQIQSLLLIDGFENGYFWRGHVVYFGFLKIMMCCCGRVPMVSTNSRF